jgi:hypothetical protein
MSYLLADAGDFSRSLLRISILAKSSILGQLIKSYSQSFILQERHNILVLLTIENNILTNFIHESLISNFTSQRLM